MTSPVRLVFIGGFLGAGKTTLMSRCARMLRDCGLRVGLITNDQAPDLVDTHWLRSQGFTVGEVAGSCFCCNFPALLNAADVLQSDGPADVLIAEPVGSCTDLSATIIQPLKDRFRSRFIVNPLTVLADPHRLRECLSSEGGTLHPDARYIFRKQLEEADMVAVNKMDVLSPAEEASLLNLVRDVMPRAEVFGVSACTGQGVREWLDAVLDRTDAGRRVADVDYDTYANGEAVLGWLNAVIDLQAVSPTYDWPGYAIELLEALGARFTSGGADVGHVKVWLKSGDHQVNANLTRTGARPWLTSNAARGEVNAQLVLNARVEMTPVELERIVRECMASVGTGQVRATVVQMRCLRPGRPVPTHRYAEVVTAS